MAGSPPDESLQLLHVRDDLRREFASLPGSVVEAEVTQVAQGFAGAPIRVYVPVLVQRGARERLRHLV